MADASKSPESPKPGPSSSAAPPTIPARTSSCKKRRAPDDRPKRFILNELYDSQRVLKNTIRAREKDLKPKASLDSEYWADYSEICSIEQKRYQLRLDIKFEEYRSDGGTLSQEDWLKETGEAEQDISAISSFERLEAIAKKQSERLNPRAKRQKQSKEIPRRLRETFVKLFRTSSLGFGFTKTGEGARDGRDQSRMRAAMKDVYGSQGPAVWEPVLGCLVEGSAVNAAHLFPWGSASSMESIFGVGARHELFSPVNGLLLHHCIKSALEKGHIAIIPNIDLDNNIIGTHPRLCNEKLAAWQAQAVKEYKVWVLDKDNRAVNLVSFAPVLGQPVETIAQLHNRPLVFQNDFRPRSRYMWWAYLNSIQQFAARQKHNESGVRKEVLNSTRYWGTQGRYVHENLLLGFVEEMGNILEPETASLIMANSKEGSAANKEADPVAVAVLTSEALIKTKEEEGHESDSEEESCEEDSEAGSDEE